jgi:hypothetical protein
VDIGTVVIAAATVVTAVATGVSALVAWHAWRGRLSTEWVFLWALSQQGERVLEVTITIVNGTSTTIAGGRVSADAKLVKQVVPASNQEKHESWAHNEAPLGSTVGPGKRVDFRVAIQLDWAALSTVRSRRLFRRSSSDVPLRIQVTVFSRSARRWRRKFSTKIEAPKEMIAAENAKA